MSNTPNALGSYPANGCDPRSQAHRSCICVLREDDEINDEVHRCLGAVSHDAECALQRQRLQPKDAIASIPTAAVETPTNLRVADWLDDTLLVYDGA